MAVGCLLALSDDAVERNGGRRFAAVSLSGRDPSTVGPASGIAETAWFCCQCATSVGGTTVTLLIEKRCCLCHLEVSGRKQKRRYPRACVEGQSGGQLLLSRRIIFDMLTHSLHG